MSWTPVRTLLSLLVLVCLACSENEKPSTADLETPVREILELPTYEHIYRDIIYLDERKSFLMFKMVDKSVLFSIDVRVQAGIDFNDGVAISESGEDGILVKLPAAKVLLVDADESSIRQYFIKESGEGIERLEYYDEIDKSKKRIVEDAISRGLLERAEEIAKRLLENFFHLAGFTTVAFEFVREVE